jgi:CheY-like chemotaxis protein
MTTNELPLAIVIEDDKDAAFIVAEALRSLDFVVETIHDGQKALDALEKVVPAMIALDMHLPNVSGHEIMKFIHTQPHLRGTKLIVITADSLLGDQMEAKADLVLLKPISFSQLRSLAERIR